MAQRLEGALGAGGERGDANKLRNLTYSRFAYRQPLVRLMTNRTQPMRGDYPMSEENKAVLRRFFEEVWNEGNLDAIDEIFSPNFTAHTAQPGTPPDREGVKQFVIAYRSAFPDVQLRVEDQVAEGDKVVTRFSSHGTHQGELMGIPATGKEINITGIGFHRVEGGQIVDGWTEFDRMGMMQQLGVVPAPGE